jgi:hypothetical protein
VPRLTVEIDDAVFDAAQRRALWERRGLREQLAVDLRAAYGCDQPVGWRPPAGRLAEVRDARRAPAPAATGAAD